MRLHRRLAALAAAPVASGLMAVPTQDTFRAGTVRVGRPEPVGAGSGG